MPGEVSSARALGATEVITVLALVDLLFVVFVAIQFVYLFGGKALTKLEDSNYKQYARRGFGELIAVSVLTLGLILVLRWLAKLDTRGQVRLFNVVSTALVALTLVVLASAWSRMLFWEEVSDYIYTDKRLYVRVFIVWLALTFLWLMISMWLRPNRFAIGAFVAVLGFLVTLNVMRS